MKSLRDAHVQRLYRPLSLFFGLLVLLVVGGTVYAGWSSTTITVTPLLKPVTVNFVVSVGPATAATDRLPGTVQSEEKTASVTITPDGQSQLVPDHATGTVTLRNVTGNDQALAIKTRLRSAGGIIVRTTKRVDVPAGGSADVEVIADPLGESGHVPPGRFVIVALAASLQDKIYGQSTEALTGGLRPGTGTLPLDQLTAASNTAQEEIRTQTGLSAPGTFRSLEPIDVSTDPPASKPSTTYRVTVKSRAITITYPAEQLMNLARQELTKVLAEGLTLSSLDEPKLTLTDRPTRDTAVLEVAVAGQARVVTGHTLLTPKPYLGLRQSEAKNVAAGSGLIKSVDVRFSPWWRTVVPKQASRVLLRVQPAQP